MRLTVFTPTYNRASKLMRLYRSLTDQKSELFEWLIVDDGSIDDTERKVMSWKKDGLISIRYIYQDNAGKMQAMNRGVQEANGDYFLCIDSDDFLVDNAIDDILKECECMEKHSNGGDICGLLALCGDVNNNPLSGQTLPQGEKYLSLFELAEKGFCADTTLVFLTNVLRRYPFPQFGDEKFITEAYVYDQIGRTYKFKLISKVWTTCEYCTDGYTQNTIALHKRYPLGWMAFYYQRISLYRSMKKKIASAALFDAHAILASRVKNIFLNRHFMLTILSIPFGFQFYRYYRKNI